jgi:hypothetical protein
LGGRRRGGWLFFVICFCFLFYGIDKNEVKYLPLFHHFTAIYQFPKHIMFLVKIVANASLIKKKRRATILYDNQKKTDLF